MDISNNNSPEFQQAKDVARKLEKVIERTSVHSCSWLVYPSSLEEIIPVQNRDSTSTLISMYDARSAEEDYESYMTGGKITNAYIFS